MYSFINILIAALFLSPNINSRTATKGVLGFTQKGNAIEAYYFPGTSNKNALVIGGVHGSEQSGIDVANELVKQLQQEEPGYYNVIVIPRLFADNTERYSHNDAVDPNRQMPSLGKAFRRDRPFDHLGRAIEQENQLLLELITTFRPERIANIHAIRTEEYAGIYADPRSNAKGIAIGFEEDSVLAVSMAMHIAANGGYVPGNRLAEQPSALYYKDPVAAAKGQVQKRNTCGSKLPGNRGAGISLGSWAATAVNDDSFPSGNRAAIQLITIEFPGYKVLPHQVQQIDAYASAIRKIFLQVTKQ